MSRDVELSCCRSGAEEVVMRDGTEHSAADVLSEEAYREVFQSIERALICEGAKRVPEEQIRRWLDDCKEIENKTFTDGDYYWILVYVVFYAGFRSATVDAKIDAIRAHFRDYHAVAHYGERKIQQILGDPDMLRHEGKIRACVRNALEMRSIVRDYDSFQAYLDSFAPRASTEGLMRLRADLRHRFSYIGPVTSLHALTEMGMPVIKPDVVIRRILYRLGLVAGTGTSESALIEVVRHGMRFVQATGYPARYIDIVLVKYGQARSPNLGLEPGICLGRNPRCDVCGVTAYCQHFAGLLGDDA